MFNQRAPEPRSHYPGWYSKLANIVNQGMFPGMMGGMGQLALNQLLVTMDGVDNPPLMKRLLHEQDQLLPRRGLHRPAPCRQDVGPHHRRRHGRRLLRFCS